MTKKACLIYVEPMKVQAEALLGRLTADGYDVCLTQAAVEAASAAQQGFATVTPAIDACLNGADIKVILLPPKEAPASLLGAAGRAGGTLGRLSVVFVDGSIVPAILFDIANSVISIESPRLIAAITTDDIHEDAEGNKKPQLIPSRVKCQ